MAERFGGKYSPGAADDAEAAIARRVRATDRRTVPLVLASGTFLISAFEGPPQYLPLDLGAVILLAFAGWLTREGERAAAAYDARPVARRPAFPRKIFASLVTGVALLVGGIGNPGGWFAIVGAAVAGAVLHNLAFGADPLRDKGMTGVDPFQRDRVAKVVDEAEARLQEMREAVGRVGDPALMARVKAFSDTARKMFRTIEEDPRDLAAARRYLVVYVTGARDAAVKFADLWSRSREPKARADFETLLDELEASFASRTQALLEDNRADLDVEIGVLRDRLKREGLNGSS